MRELRSNPSLRIAAIAFAIFIIVGTIAIFAFPDDEATPSDTSSGVPPTISVANQTRIAAFNATALAGTATPQAGSSIPPPALTDQRPADIAFTGNGHVDSTLNVLWQSRRYDSVNNTGWIDIVCRNDTHGPASCAGSPTGTTVRSFAVLGCPNIEFLTDPQDVQQLVRRTLERHPAWFVAAVLREGVPGLTSDGYAAGLQAGSGNTGDIWYIDLDGRIVAIDTGCGGHTAWSDALPLDPARPDLPYVYKPCSGLCVTPSPQP